MRPLGIASLLPFIVAAVGCANGVPPKVAARDDVRPCIPDRDPVVELHVAGPKSEEVFRDQTALNWYSPRALDLGRTGEAVLQCAVADGKATGCAILSGNESGFSFGSLALRAATRLPLPEGSDGPKTQLRYRWVILDPGPPPSTVCWVRDPGVSNRLPRS